MALIPSWKASVWSYLDVKVAHKDIRRLLKGKVSYRTVSRYISQYKVDWQDLNMLGHLPRSGRPPKTTARQQYNVKRALVAGTTSKVVAKHFNVSTRTINKIAKKQKLKYSPMANKQFLTAKNQATRLAFCQKMRLRPSKWWRSVLWTDECPIPLTPMRKKYYWREAGTPKKFQFFEKNSGTVWVWAKIWENSSRIPEP